MDSVLMVNKVLNIDKSNWQLTKLGDLLKDISKRVDNPSQSGNDRFVGLEHFVSGDIKIKKWGATENLTSSTKAFKAGDILFARRNAYLRRASLVDFDGCCSGDAFVLRENHNKVVPGFMAFFMNSNTVWDFANENAAGTMSKRVKWRDLANYEFLLPPKDQQAKLAELLWAMDEVIEREIETKLTIKNYLDSVSGRIFSRRVSSFLGELPFDIASQDWTNCCLDDLCVLVTDGAHASPKTVEGGYPIGTVENMLENKIDVPSCRTIGLEDFNYLKRNNCKPQLGDILFSKDGTIGKTFVFNQPDDLILLSSIAIIRTKKNLLISDYCSLMLESPVFNSEIEKRKSGTALKRVVLKDIKKFRINLPSVDFQTEVASYLNSLKLNIRLLESKIATSRALQKSLINQIF
jgi:type I restriction enzyme S subunit